MKLTKDEQETLIYQNAEDRTKWIIYSDDKVRVREFRAKNLKELGPKGVGVEFELNDSSMTIRKQRVFKSKKVK